MDNHFISFGGGGANILLSLETQNPIGLITMISDPKRDNLPEQIRFIHYPNTQVKPTIRNYPNDVEDDAMYQNLIIPSELIERISRNQNIVLISSLGGYTGTILLDYFINFLAENNYRFSVHCGWPLKFEGPPRLHSAIKFRLKHLHTNKVTHYKSIVDETFNNWDSTIGNFYKELNCQIAAVIYKKHH